jgi:hypothetical protein
MKTLKLSICLVSLISSALVTQSAFAFPELIRAGYTNCISCHVSPNGGAVLSQYGRQSSATVLSTWGSEKESTPFYGWFKQPDWIDTEAFIKGVQTATNNSALSNGYFWYMEADLEAAARFGKDEKWTADVAVGISPDVLNGLKVPGSSPFISHRHYLMYRLDDMTTVRAGKFIPDYGVYFQDHTIPTRQGLGFDEGMETYNLEYSYQGDQFSGSVTADLGRIDNPSLNLDKGVAATGAVAVSDSAKVGLSGFFGTHNSIKRELAGPYALLGFTKHFYFLGEGDLQFTEPSGSSATTKGIATYERLGYEVFQGFNVYVLEQTYVYDFGGNFEPATINPMYGIISNRLTGVGPGIYWYPRPHFYFQLEVQQQFSPAFPSAETFAFLVGSFYF